MQPIPQPLAEILDLARWAPSGDNTQPWRFEIIDENHLIIHAFDTRAHCVYDLDGHPSQISLGALFETLAIAASVYGLQSTFKRETASPDTHPKYLVTLTADGRAAPDPLHDHIKQRSVQRRPMRTAPLSEQQKQTLQQAVGQDYTVYWFEGRQRWRIAKLMFDNAKIRLTLPEAYSVHRDAIAWKTRFSEDKVPDQTLGLDAVTLKLMRWVMVSWRRVTFFNTYLAGHLLPRIEMDLLPGLFCAAHFSILASKIPQTIGDYVAAGRAAQRFWLTATRLGLGLQPGLTPLIFSRYVRQERTFTQSHSVWKRAQALSAQLDELLAGAAPQTVFMGRIGQSDPPLARSLRLPLQQLLVPTKID